jgi:hypothetical protein
LLRNRARSDIIDLAEASHVVGIAEAIIDSSERGGAIVALEEGPESNGKERLDEGSTRR